MVWRTAQDISGLTDEALLNAKRHTVKLTGPTVIEIEVNGRRVGFNLDGKCDPGDGTVPTASGAAASRLEGIKDVFKLDGFDHAFSYQNEIAQHTVLYAIGKMVQEIQLKEDGTCVPCEPL